jgi:hypothetical protein
MADSRRLAWLRVQIREARPELSDTRVRRMALVWYTRAARRARPRRCAPRKKNTGE